MAATVTYSTPNTLKEGLMDLLTIVDVKKTPFLSSLNQEKIKSVHMEWLTDSLASADANNAAVEGADYSFSAASDRTRVENYTQIFTKTWQVSNSQDIADKAGMETEWAYQMDKAMKEAKRDMEKALFQGTMSAGTVSAARKLKGAEAFITTNADTVSAQLSETHYNDILQDIVDAGGDPDTVYVNSYQKRKISAFTASATRNIDSSDKRLVANVDIYEGDFGVQKIVHDIFVTNSAVVVITANLWSLGVYRPLAEDPNIAKTGDSRKGALVGEVTLICKNEKGNGKITGLPTTA